MADGELAAMMTEGPAEQAAERWMEEALDRPAEAAPLLRLLRILVEREMAAAQTALALVAEEWISSGHVAAALLALRLWLELDPGDPEPRRLAGLAVRRAFGEGAAGERFVAATGIDDRAVPTGVVVDRAENVVALVEGAVCHHRSWGYGRVREVAPWEGTIRVDFEGKPGHAFQIAYAAEALIPLPAEHLVARRLVDPEGVRRLAWEAPAAIVEAAVLAREQARVTPAWIEEQMAGSGIIAGEQWKKWWALCRAAVARDPRFELPARKTAPIVFHPEAQSAADRFVAHHREASGLAEKVAALEKYMRARLREGGPGTAPAGAAAAILPVLDDLDREIRHHARANPAPAYQALLLREQAAAGHGQPASDRWMSEADLIGGLDRAGLAGLLDGLNATQRRRVLGRLAAAGPQWIEEAFSLADRVGAASLESILEVGAEHPGPDAVLGPVRTLVRRPDATAEALLALVRTYRRDHPVLGRIAGPELLLAGLRCLEQARLHEGAAPRGVRRLYDCLAEGGGATVRLLEGSDEEAVNEFVQRIQASAVFQPLDRQSILGHLVRHYPHLKEMLAGTGGEGPADMVYVSHASYARRKAEYEDLVQRQIPENSREIALARSYGDLRENFEYKAAKDMQRVLMRRQQEMGRDLARAKPTDFADATGETAAMGTEVELVPADGEAAPRRYVILGAWDGDPERGVLSYQSAVAQALLGRRVSEVVKLVDAGGIGRDFRIVSIRPQSHAADPS